MEEKHYAGNTFLELIKAKSDTFPPWSQVLFLLPAVLVFNSDSTFLKLQHATHHFINLDFYTKSHHSSHTMMSI